MRCPAFGPSIRPVWCWICNMWQNVEIDNGSNEMQSYKTCILVHIPTEDFESWLPLEQTEQSGLADEGREDIALLTGLVHIKPVCLTAAIKYWDNTSNPRLIKLTHVHTQSHTNHHITRQSTGWWLHLYQVIGESTLWKTWWEEEWVIAHFSWPDWSESATQKHG